MAQYSSVFIKAAVALSGSLLLASSLAGCGTSSGSFGVVPLASSANESGRSDDWRSPRIVDRPLRSRPSSDPSADASPSDTPVAATAAPSVLPSPTPSAQATASPIATASPDGTPVPRESAPVAPSSPATVAPTATPNAATMLLPYDPPAGTYAFFPTSAYRQPLPANPTVNANSATWLAALGAANISGIQFAQNASGLSNDYTFPIYPMNALAATSKAVTVHCTEPWGTCPVEGKTVYVDARELPEDGGASGKDSHFALVDTVGGQEYDFWGTQWPARNGVLTIAWGGMCSLSGSGSPGCDSTATDTPLSLGIVRVSDLFAAMASPAGSLPYALQVAVKCTNGYVAPATAGDGKTAGCPPEGSRVYLQMHDTDVDALAESNIAKALLRTIDEDHYGMIISDQNGGEDGFSVQLESDLTYTTFGQPGPLVTQLVPEAVSEGLTGTAPYQNDFYMKIPFDGINLANSLKFV